MQAQNLDVNPKNKQVYHQTLIVATINTISHSCPVHHGTFLKFSLINFVAVSVEKSSSLHTIILKNKTQTKQHFVLYYNQVYFSLDLDQMLHSSCNQYSH